MASWRSAVLVFHGRGKSEDWGTERVGSARFCDEARSLQCPSFARSLPAVLQIILSQTYHISSWFILYKRWCLYDLVCIYNNICIYIYIMYHTHIKIPYIYNIYINGSRSVALGKDFVLGEALPSKIRIRQQKVCLAAAMQISWGSCDNFHLLSTFIDILDGKVVQ